VLLSFLVVNTAGQSVVVLSTFNQVRKCFFKITCNWLSLFTEVNCGPFFETHCSAKPPMNYNSIEQSRS
jgi:hypothetical protein